ncbi:hypothetical protein N7494_012276 [Penicillium frequentans]|uniref:Uncharacterized protein n=1 Tax=Penicillium frequentans TaxID=3151616 RepID=A0AAD6CLD7_9EURO|nr:hypothetical protein N7494_012276 [Penicillium glabrum]
MAKSPDGDKREKKYEERGDIYTLQEYRANKASDDAYRDPTHKFLRTERRLREIAQREVSLSAEIKEVPVSSDRSQKIEKELLDLREEYFMTDQKRGRFLDNCPSETLIRGLNLWRSHPQWTVLIKVDVAVETVDAAKVVSLDLHANLELGTVPLSVGVVRRLVGSRLQTKRSKL